MNPVAIFAIAAVIVLFAIGSFVGRANQEWKNLLRIIIGVGGVFVVWRVILFSSYDGWTKVGLMVLLCAVLFALNMFKQMKRTK